MWRTSFSSIWILYIGVVLVAMAYWPDVSLAKGGRAGGGGMGGGRGSFGGGGRVASSGRSSSYGSSARSGSSSSSARTASSSSGVSATKYGSSAPTGGGFSSSGGYGTGSRYNPGGTAYRAPSKTFSRVASPGTGRASAASRPTVNTGTAARSPATPVVYSPTYNTYNSAGRMSSGGFGGGSMLLAGGAGLIGGYYMGRMMGSMSGGYGGYGYSPYQSYVPYRDQYGRHYVSTTPSPLVSGNQALQPEMKKQLDLCTLARWNRELPFTELPNMALQFLSNDSVSGISSSDKSKFVQGFFKNASEGYKTYNSSSDIFTIPASYNLAAECKFQNAADVDVSKTVSSGTVEEPLITALRNIIQQYGTNTDQSGLQDVVTATKNCLPRPSTTEGQPPSNLEVLPCLDYSLSPDQLMHLDKPQSVFGNEEVCHRQLNPDMFKCMAGSGEHNGGGCTQEHLVALNVFARNYYLCVKELDDDTLHKLQAQERQQQGWPSRGATSAGRETLTILLPSIVTLLVAAL